LFVPVLIIPHALLLYSTAVILEAYSALAVIEGTHQKRGVVGNLMNDRKDLTRPEVQICKNSGSFVMALGGCRAVVAVFGQGNVEGQDGSPALGRYLSSDDLGHNGAGCGSLHLYGGPDRDRGV
jgi:hypothetical protein